VSYLARYSGRTHALYAYQLKQWFAWCETNGLDPLVGVQRAHVELYIRQLGDRGLMDSSVVTMMHAVRGYFRFAHIDGLIGSDPAVYSSASTRDIDARPFAVPGDLDPADSPVSVMWDLVGEVTSRPTVNSSSTASAVIVEVGQLDVDLRS